VRRISIIAVVALAVGLVPNHASATTKLKTKVYAEAFVNDPEDVDDIEGFLVFVGSKKAKCEKDRDVSIIEHFNQDPNTDGEVFGSGVTDPDPMLGVGVAVIDGSGEWEQWYRFTVAKAKRGNVVCLARTGLFFYSAPE
jgi:hypothetical protein